MDSEERVSVLEELDDTASKLEGLAASLVYMAAAEGESNSGKAAALAAETAEAAALSIRGVWETLINYTNTAQS